MSDKYNVYNASALVDTGEGQVMAIILSITTGTGIATIYNDTKVGTAKILEVSVSSTEPVIIFLSESFFIEYTVGCYLALAANMAANIWTRQF